MSFDVEIVLPTRAQIGEGALWDAARQRLLWIDVANAKVFLYDPATGSNQAFDTGTQVGTVVLRRQGGTGPAGAAMIATENGIAELDLSTGRITPWINPEAGSTINRFNDGKCDPAGRFWVGTMRNDFRLPTANLWCLYPDGHVERKLSDLTCSNGIVWTSDTRTMYYIDTPTHQVWAFDYDLATGNISNRRTAVEVPHEMGGPDGMAIDVEDKIWVALWGGGRVVRFDPQTGKTMLEIPVPGARCVTSCAFGGAALDELYITTAAGGTKPAEQPHAGHLLRVRVPVRGAPTHAFAG
jgi:sugar lactone lactonase YvrE